MYELSWPDLEVGFQSLLPPLTFSLCPLSGAHGWKRELGKFRKSEGMLPRVGRWKREPPPPTSSNVNPLLDREGVCRCEWLFGLHWTPHEYGPLMHAHGYCFFPTRPDCK